MVDTDFLSDFATPSRLVLSLSWVRGPHHGKALLHHPLVVRKPYPVHEFSVSFGVILGTRLTVICHLVVGEYCTKNDSRQRF